MCKSVSTYSDQIHCHRCVLPAFSVAVATVTSWLIPCNPECKTIGLITTKKERKNTFLESEFTPWEWEIDGKKCLEIEQMNTQNQMPVLSCRREERVREFTRSFKGTVQVSWLVLDSKLAWKHTKWGETVQSNKIVFRNTQELNRFPLVVAEGCQDGDLRAG